jgi:hypothetical protein
MLSQLLTVKRAVFLVCGHLIHEECSVSISSCPMCRRTLTVVPLSNRIALRKAELKVRRLDWYFRTCRYWTNRMPLPKRSQYLFREVKDPSVCSLESLLLNPERIRWKKTTPSSSPSSFGAQFLHVKGNFWKLQLRTTVDTETGTALNHYASFGFIKHQRSSKPAAFSWLFFAPKALQRTSITTSTSEIRVGLETGGSDSAREVLIPFRIGIIFSQAECEVMATIKSEDSEFTFLAERLVYMFQLAAARGLSDKDRGTDKEYEEEEKERRREVASSLYSCYSE